MQLWCARPGAWEVPRDTQEPLLEVLFPQEADVFSSIPTHYSLQVLTILQATSLQKASSRWTWCTMWAPWRWPWNKCNPFELQVSAAGARKQSSLYCNPPRLAQGGCVPEALCWVLGKGECCGQHLILKWHFQCKAQISSQPMTCCSDPCLSYTLLLPEAINKPSPLDSRDPSSNAQNDIYCLFLTIFSAIVRLVSSPAVPVLTSWNSHTMVNSLWYGYCPKGFP